MQIVLCIRNMVVLFSALFFTLTIQANLPNKSDDIIKNLQSLGYKTKIEDNHILLLNIKNFIVITRKDDLPIGYTLASPLPLKRKPDVRLLRILNSWNFEFSGVVVFTVNEDNILSFIMTSLDDYDPKNFVPRLMLLEQTVDRFKERNKSILAEYGVPKL